MSDDPKQKDKLPFVVENFMAQGSFGKVYKCKFVNSEKTVAVKAIDLDFNQNIVDFIQREISILCSLKSEYCTMYYGSYLVDTTIWIALEYCGGGSCHDLVKALLFNLI